MPSSSSEEKYPFGEGFQTLVLAHMLGDHNFVPAYRDALNWKYFDREIHRDLAEMVLNHFDRYGSTPTAIALKEEIDGSTFLRDDRKTEILYCLMSVLKTPPTDGEYVKDKVVEFGKAMAIKMAMVRGVEYLKERQYDQIISEISAAGAVGSAQGNDGVFLVSEFEEKVANWDFTLSSRKIPTLFPTLDDLIRGGAHGGTLNAVAAPAKRGKSTFLLNVGFAALTQGYKVAHFTGELQESFIVEKYGARMTGIASQHVMSQKDKFRAEVGVLERKKTDVLIKYFPQGWRARDFDNFLTRIANTRGFIPDVIIIDYDKQIGTDGRYDDNSYSKGEEIYTALKNLAMERDVPIWTASQANREAVKGETFGEEKVSDSFAKAMLCDLMLTISKPQSDVQPGQPVLGSLWVALNRIGHSLVNIPTISNLASATIRETCPVGGGNGGPVIDLPTIPGGSVVPGPGQPGPGWQPPRLPELPGSPPSLPKPPGGDGGS
jgi:replicative DNA helicase